MAKKVTVKKSTAGLSPGKSQFVKSQDLAPSIFRRLVARRIRSAKPGEDFMLPKSEKDRKKFEAILEKINNEPNFLPVSFLTDGSARSQAVCRVVVPTSRGRSLGTGFLITSKLIMTNNHVLTTKDDAEEATAEFQFEGDQSPIVVAIRPDRFFLTDRDLDFTIVACDGRGVGEIAPIPLRRNPALVTRQERVNIIQHPRGRRKEVALHANKVTRIRDTVVHYSTDTEPGSSGSPVFNNLWELVALHHAGFAGPGGSATNEGIRISAIVDHIIRQSGNNESESDREVVDELLSSIKDSSPILGFFGTAGLNAGDAEVQVNGFQGTPNFADIGCWNIEHFNNRISSQRVTDVGEVVERLSLDVFGLSEVENGAVKRLVQDLNRRGSRYDFVLRDTRGRQDLAVLFDTDTTEVTRRADIADRNRSALRARTSANKTAFPRFPLFAQCKVTHEGDSVEFIMIVVHLKAFGDAQSRARRRLAAEKLALVIKDIRDNEGLPVVLCGDFNERLDNDVLNAVSDTPDLFPLTADDATDGAISFVGNRHRSLIDHIIVSRDVRLGDISGDDAAIIRLDRTVRDFSDRVSDHVPIVFRMILHDEPIVIPPIQPDGEGRVTLSIPVGASKVQVDFD